MHYPLKADKSLQLYCPLKHTYIDSISEERHEYGKVDPKFLKQPQGSSGAKEP